MIEQNRRWRLDRIRLRTRLMIAFVMVAVGTGAVLVLTTYLLIREQRTSTFEERSLNETRLALLSAPEELNTEVFDELLLAFQERGAVDGLVVTDADGDTYSSLLLPSDVPPVVQSAPEDELRSDDVSVDGQRFHLVAGQRNEAVYVFAFSRAVLDESITETRDLLLVGWLVATVVAAVLGRRIAGRTLAPVGRAAEASESLAAGMLDTRLPESTDDEFARLAVSFNKMADALSGKIDELSAAAERERQFTADVAHELKTPLTTMATASSIVRPSLAKLPQDVQRPVELLLDDVDRLRQLILDLLELARHDAGQERVEVDDLLLADAIDAVVSACGADGRIRLDVPPTATLTADRRRFARVVGNLLSNALEHGADPIEIRVRQEALYVSIDVIDHGSGFGEGDPARLFDRFHKEDVSRSAVGSGLGLPIALENARLLGGTIVAENLETATRFSFRLPVAPLGGSGAPGPPAR